MRPSFEDIFMDLAISIARRSTCKRLQVGTVITTDDYRKVISIGYNGNASGFPNTCDKDAVGACGDVHSEANAIINCDSPRGIWKNVFVTVQPCVMCAKYLVNLGHIACVYYQEPYRLTDGLDVFAYANIKVQRVRWVGDDVASESPASKAP